MEGGAPARISLSLEESLPAGIRMVCFSSILLGSMPWFKAMISLADTSAQQVISAGKGMLGMLLPGYA